MVNSAPASEKDRMRLILGLFFGAHRQYEHAQQKKTAEGNQEMLLSCRHSFVPPLITGRTNAIYATMQCDARKLPKPFKLKRHSPLQIELSSGSAHCGPPMSSGPSQPWGLAANINS